MADRNRTLNWWAASALAGMSGAAAHSALMLAKNQLRLLPDFQPYEALQVRLAGLLGGSLHPLVAAAISLLSGATIVGLLFGRIYPALPFRSGLGKGLSLGLIAWLIMNLALFPSIGLGYFALRTRAGLGASAFSLLMLSVYGVVMGCTFSILRHAEERSARTG